MRRARAETVAVPDVFRALIVALRPRQWTKNGLLFVALAFTLNLHRPELLGATFVAFLGFCALSSAGYLVNDVVDAESDRNHPLKRSRPIASRALPANLALVIGFGLALIGVLLCLAVTPGLAGLAVAYLVLTATYTLWLKHLVLLDIFAIAAGFVLRAGAGAVAIDVPISPWLYTSTLLGALLIALGKRRVELQALGTLASRHRRNLAAYSLDLIDQLVIVVSSTALMTYALYTFSAENLPKNHSMMLTIPVVLYGLFRYLYLLRTSEMGGAPEELLLRDRPLLAAVVVWAVLAVTLLYLGAGTP